MTSTSPLSDVMLPADMPTVEETRKHDRLALASLLVGVVLSLGVFFYVAV